MQVTGLSIFRLRLRIAEADIQLRSAESTAERKRIEKVLLGLQKKQTELTAFEALLRHYADQKDVCGKEEE